MLELADDNGTVNFPALVPASTLFGAWFTRPKTRCVKLVDGNRILPQRTTEQQAADAAAGREYRDYGLVTGDCDKVNGVLAQAESGTPVWQRELSGVYFDSSGYPWMVDLTDVRLDQEADVLSGDVVFRRLFTISDSMQDDVAVTSLNLSPAGLDGITDLPAGPGVEPWSVAVVVADQNEDGTRFLLTNRGLNNQASIDDAHARYDIFHMYPLVVWELTITDVPDSGYPRSGNIDFSVTASVRRSFISIRDAVAHTFLRDVDGTDGQVL
ncbi:MAG: hypothetical protein U5P41_07220 [Gammaproteobacteria bacterium]|nr:hypothetical protein [Gammaproteobacteria bacterium]